MADKWVKHCLSEFRNLGYFLPALYASAAGGPPSGR
jgi:hypothetical protein